ncbi:predicted protein [Nematostella vectensis]|uniref:Fibrinogen C-terminal domain-containing protein n=1 Tax=Nematostella vectensis TaxID=45351 RepID=A7T1Y8_NEMVE|nr:predicted protein [Nematostella vectensis]|eukprot:XP_001622129.1 hypothetical protein NEMVEDRAFT_v1g221117 [Nematostella vectensis]
MYSFLAVLCLIAGGYARVLDEQYCHNQETYFTIYQVPNHGCKCTAKVAGALRYKDGNLQVCNGNEYVNVGGNAGREAPVGTETNPGKSCRDILTKRKKKIKMYSFLAVLCLIAGGYARVLDEQYCHNQETYFTIYQVPNHGCKCTAKVAGALRYKDGNLQVCNGNEYVNVGGNAGQEAPVGTETNPGKSCRDILTKRKCSPDNGDKTIKSFGYIFAQERQEDALLGSFDKPAKSCKEIVAARPDAQNGVYYLNLRDAPHTRVYCHMTEICGSRGWTIIMKIDGREVLRRQF